MSDFHNVLRAAVEERLAFVNAHKEELITAWVAKHGFEPDACKLVQQDKGGVVNFWVEEHGDRCLTHRNEIADLRKELEKVTKERDEFKRKGEDLCHIVGNTMIALRHKIGANLADEVERIIYERDHLREGVRLAKAWHAAYLKCARGEEDGPYVYKIRESFRAWAEKEKT